MKSKLCKVLQAFFGGCVAYAAIIAEVLKLVCSSPNRVLKL